MILPRSLGICSYARPCGAHHWQDEWASRWEVTVPSSLTGPEQAIETRFRGSPAGSQQRLERRKLPEEATFLLNRRNILGFLLDWDRFREDS